MVCLCFIPIPRGLSWVWFPTSIFAVIMLEASYIYQFTKITQRTNSGYEWIGLVNFDSNNFCIKNQFSFFQKNLLNIVQTHTHTHTHTHICFGDAEKRFFMPQTEENYPKKGGQKNIFLVTKK